MIPGKASGVFFAALWNKAILPGSTLEVTRLVISAALKSFQSKLSPLATASSTIYGLFSVDTCQKAEP